MATAGRNQLEVAFGQLGPREDIAGLGEAETSIGLPFSSVTLVMVRDASGYPGTGEFESSEAECDTHLVTDRSRQDRMSDVYVNLQLSR